MEKWRKPAKTCRENFTLWRFRGKALITAPLHKAGAIVDRNVVAVAILDLSAFVFVSLVLEFKPCAVIPESARPNQDQTAWCCQLWSRPVSSS